jgi:hypothetical protein
MPHAWEGQWASKDPRGSPMGSSYKYGMTLDFRVLFSSSRVRDNHGQWEEDRGALEAWGLLVGRLHFLFAPFYEAATLRG